MIWQKVHASVKGTSHKDSGIVCQDVGIADTFCTIRNEAIFVAIASDGAGSATLSHRGASIACSTAHQVLKNFLLEQADAVDFSLFEVPQLVAAIKDRIRLEAESAGVVTREFACTLLLAAVGERSSLYLQIGDGAIVVKSQNLRRVIFWPDAGEYANQTYFITEDDAESHLKIVVDSFGVTEVAVFTDGLQRLALRYSEKLPHESFFAPLFRYLRDLKDNPNELYESLLDWLDSEPVNSRTDDDKTLILAARLEVDET